MAAASLTARVAWSVRFFAADDAGEMLDLAQIGVSAFSRQDFDVQISAPTWLGDITIVIVIQRRQRYGALRSRENM